MVSIIGLEKVELDGVQVIIGMNQEWLCFKCRYILITQVCFVTSAVTSTEAMT